MTVVSYDGPRYEMIDEDLARVRELWRIGGEWEEQADMPIIEIEAGMILDFGGNYTLSKRSGQNLIAACADSGCGGTIVQIKDFGCGTGCVTMSSTSWSGLVYREFHAKPYPTMDTWSDIACTGNKQHFGVEDTSSCTNSDGRYKSFIGWFNC
ncbi:hypothetical protein BJ170DRAFT_626132 [Xylariales sp. AK1849]|nr:hypothetical protein BJ170DRAFT_626132 [Xylariales sp. AK1849]